MSRIDNQRQHTIIFIIRTITVIVVVIALVPVAAMPLVHAAVAIGNGPGCLELNPGALALDSRFAIRDVSVAFLRRVDDRFTDILALAGHAALV